MQGVLGKQGGAVLVVSLILLLIVTLLGVSAIQTTTLEEKMAANTRNRDLAFQAAEVALRAAEADIDANVTRDNGFSDNCQTTSGYCAQVAAAEPYQRWKNPNFCGTDLDIWQCGASVALSGAQALDTGIYAAQPRYIIEVLQEVGVDGGGNGLNLGNIGDQIAADSAMYYRITAIGYGGTAAAHVVLQSTYGK